MNLNTMSSINPTEAQAIIDNAKKENRKVFIYLRSINDHNFNIKKELVVKVYPNILTVTKDGIRFDSDVVGKTYINKYVINRIPESYVTHWNDVDFYNWTFYIYLLSEQNIKDYIEELENEKKEIDDVMGYLICG